VLSFKKDRDFDENRVLDGGKNTWQKRQSFSWSLEDDKAQVKIIYLIRIADAPEQVGGPYKAKETPDVVRQVLPSVEGADILVDPSATSVDLNLEMFTDENEGLTYGGAYAVKVSWEYEDGQGKGSVSGYFSVLEEGDDDADKDMERRVQESLSKLDHYEDGFESSGDTIPSAAESSGLPAEGTTSRSDNNPSSTSNADSGAGDDSGNGAGGGGLAPGTIAGIVVGVVGGLALIGALVFLLLRRRRRRHAKQHHTHVVPLHEADMSTYGVDKVDGNVAQSPYTDDGHGMVATGFAPNAAHDAAGAPQSATAAAGAADSHGPVRGEPVGVDSPSREGRYSHLVEEGMTEDDIRRLEEEERELDAEIARARGG
jgi:hypothetical protein